MKAYIASKFTNVEGFNEIHTILKDNNITLTVDWTKHLNVKPFREYHSVCMEQSLEDIKGIEDCDYFIFKYDGEKGSGMFFELGYAYALKKNIIAIGHGIMDISMFIHLPLIKYSDVDGLGKLLKKKG